MNHFDRSEIVPPERNAKQYIFPLFFKHVTRAKSFLYNAYCPRVAQVEWKPYWKAIFYTLMYTYIARKSDACVEIHPLMLHVWNGKWYIIYLTRFKACFPSGTESNVTVLVLKSCILSGCQSDIIFFVLKRVWPLGEGKEINISLGVLNRVQIAS